MSSRDFVFEKIAEQNKWRKQCINLIASENVTSSWVDMAYKNDFTHRYAEGLPFKRYYQGTRIIDELESLANKEFSKAFSVRTADVRPISGAIANMALMRAFTKHGNVITSLSVPSGAHSSHNKGGVAGGILGLNQVELPFDAEDWRIDADLASKLIQKAKPKLAVVGASLIPFPLEIEGLVAACRNVDCKLVYDAAHVFGLIFSGEFQQPFKEGADMLTSSTHKTFPGPQGGIIMSNIEEGWDQVERAIFPRILSNHHLHRIPALLVAFHEMKEFGQAYSRQILRNAKRLAESMFDLGFAVAGEGRGFTESHQVVVDLKEQGGGQKPAKLLDAANIILNKNLLPWDKVSKETLRNPSGIRIGVQEMTRFGMKREQMEEIAELIARVVLKGEEPSKVRKDVIAFRKDFQKIQYTWEWVNES